ncbi:cation diffusion facilitator family transporter [Halogeometricum pallidum JCM 14848]|uniref:Cation diffusion facilitator family transporter n=1 Tax=Halogeometricum pallidum JCM 14848 TaxID=1227487 RepID=M0DDV7_HALPD|nr:cation diffusion facilitator family transporter [Halogeometricum pallidum]ELZ32917.1 cation diffusion facilitator family transporter [Halogeometricum pallidum JCM 14848]
MAESKSVVVASLIANGSIAVMKFVGFLLTGSAAMLSETYQSVSDTGNQIFLLFGLRYSKRRADRDHPFGYGKAQFFYAFLVSVLLFGVAGIESARKGYETLVGGGSFHVTNATIPVIELTLSGAQISYAVLLFAIAFESWALKKAYDGIKVQIDEHNWSGLREAFRKTSDVTTLTALTEDSIALAGATIGIVGIYLTEKTGNAMYDGIAALLIGLLLMGFAVALAWQNKRLLLGESLPADAEQRLRDIVTDAEGVERLVDFRTVYFGPEEIVVTADVAFDSTLGADGIDARISEIKRQLTAAEPQIRKAYLEPQT